MREGDIESLRRKMKDEGRPIRSNQVFDGRTTTHYREKGGRVEITDKSKDRSERA